MTDYSKDRIWAEVNLDSVVFTYDQIRKMAGGKKIMPVIKADAYGHGAVTFAKVYLEAGADCFAVSTANEAIELRDAGVTVPILVLGTVPADCVKELVRQNIMLCVPCTEVAELYRTQTGGNPIKIQIKVDSGMGRLGFSGKHAADDVIKLASDPDFRLCGIFTHFASSGERKQDEFTLRQYKHYTDVVGRLRSAGFHIPMVHCANSDAIVNFPDFLGDYVRPGIILYGYASPSPDLLPLKPALSLRARVLQTKWIGAGQPVGYSCAWTAEKRTRIATISAGYADGLPRSASMKIDMLVSGTRAPQVGRICMDMSMLDVTAVPDVRVGDVVTIVGRDGDQSIWMDELAAKSGTIPHEPLTQLTKRVPRYYVRDQGDS